jgi:hypothetical protein
MSHIPKATKNNDILEVAKRYYKTSQPTSNQLSCASTAWKLYTQGASKQAFSQALLKGTINEPTKQPKINKNSP